MRLCKNRTCKATLPKGSELRHCSDECGTVLAMESVAKRRAQIAKAKDREARARKKEFRANDKPHQLDLTRRAFNTFIRALDRGKRCPTCNEPLEDGRYDAGHVRTVASCPALRFDPRNCFGQCRSCNGSGTIRRKTRKTQEAVSLIYKEWVLETMGQQYHDWLYGPHAEKHYTIDDLVAIRKSCAAETKRINSGQPPSRDWRKIE